jgi:cyclic pyranopterin phosphate synthase
MEADTALKISSHGLTKGDVLGVARIAAIQGAKRTFELVPYAQEALLGAIEVNFVLGASAVRIETRVESRDDGDVEMEALTACMVAALTIYDMCKAIDRSMSIGSLSLVRSEPEPELTVPGN